MKCSTIRYAGKRRIEFVEVDVPDPKDWEVQVEALACGVCAWDVHVFKHGSDWTVCPGHEGVGRVVKVGRFVSQFKEGDRVTGQGMGFSERCNMSADQLYLIPESELGPEHWIVEPVSCVVTGHDHCNLRAGDRIAVVGCGFMGLMLVQVLARSPLDMLIAIDIDAGRLEMARGFGASHTYESGTVDLPELQKLGIDCVIDCTGNAAGLDLSSRILRPGGRLNLFGWNHGTGSFPGDLWHLNGLTVINSAPGSAIRNPWPAAIRLLHRGIVDLRPLVTHVVELKDYPALLAKAADREDGYIKGVVRLGSAAPQPALQAPAAGLPADASTAA